MITLISQEWSIASETAKNNRVVALTNLGQVLNPSSFASLTVKRRPNFSMTPRRTHTKTRTGCYSCKKRHIKCDELGPPCANCQVRGIKCNQYPPANPSQQPSPVVSDSSVPETTFPSDKARLLEIELIHKWSTETYQDFNIVSNDQEFWQIVVPQEALSHEFLLEAILAISSLHVAITTSPSRANVYHTAALQYQDRAIADFKTKALPVKLSNHRALFAFSIIVLTLAFAIPRHSPRDHHDRSILTHLKTMFGLLQGTTSIFRSSKEWFQDSPFAKLLYKYHERDPSRGLEGGIDEALRQLRALNDAEYVSSSAEDSRSLPDMVIWHENNTKAIDWLQKCFRSDSGEGTLRCLTWLATLEPAFMYSIEQGEPFALLVTMHWAILLHYCGENTWWARSSGKILITELCMALAPHKKATWSSQIAWIYHQVGLPVVA